MTKEEFDRMSLDEICWNLSDEGKSIHNNYTVRNMIKKLIDEGCFKLAADMLYLLEKERKCSWFRFSFIPKMTCIPIKAKDDIRDLAFENDVFYKFEL